MEEDIYLDKLDRRGIKPTAIRLLVIKAMMQAERAVSLLDLETLLDTVDKSTISRTIELLLKQNHENYTHNRAHEPATYLV